MLGGAGGKVRASAKVTRQPKTVEEWLEARKKQWKTFKTTPEGALLSPAVQPGDTELIITTTPRVPASKEHIESA